jgi:hypothetical protein
MEKPIRNIRAAGFVLVLLFVFPGFVSAADERSLPLDLYLIIDTSSEFREAETEAAAWINGQVIDRILQEGDTLTIWSAGDSARVVFAEPIGGNRESVREKLKNLDISGKKADFTGALREAVSRAGAVRDPGRLAVTMVVSGSARALAPSLDGGSGGLFRWSRIDEYAGWQALVVAPGIGEKVKNAAAAYMNGG